MISFKQLIPLIRIIDMVKAREFYIEWLGFHVDWERRSGEKALLQISRGDLVLRLSEHGVKTPGAKVMVHMTGIELFQKELTDRNHDLDNNFDNPVLGDQTIPRNARNFTVTDPSTNRIVFIENTE